MKNVNIKNITIKFDGDGVYGSHDGFFNALAVIDSVEFNFQCCAELDGSVWFDDCAYDTGVCRGVNEKLAAVIGWDNVLNLLIRAWAQLNKSERENALIDCLDIIQDEYEFVETSADNDLIVDFGGAEYAVYTKSEADTRAHEYIRESLWAFNADFIIEHSSVLDYDNASRSIINAIQEQCESGNDAVLKLIDDIDDFVADAIAADGRGHFLSSYDGGELETVLNDKRYFIYRMG